MAEIHLTQAEAEALLAMEKHRVDGQAWNYGGLAGSVAIPLISADRREHFLLDICRGRINLQKGTYQNRARQAVILARLDFGGSPHRNPDGEEIPGPHLHLYREGYGDRWASPPPADRFAPGADPWETLQEFMRFCNISRPPELQRGLFA
jgi:hypothetical protein